MMLADAMDTKEVFVLLALLVNFAAMIGGAVFVVTSVKTTTAVLVSQVKALHYSINRLNDTHENLDNKVDAHAERLTRLETKTQKARSEG